MVFLRLHMNYPKQPMFWLRKCQLDWTSSAGNEVVGSVASGPPRSAATAGIGAGVGGIEVVATATTVVAGAGTVLVAGRHGPDEMGTTTVEVGVAADTKVGRAVLTTASGVVVGATASGTVDDGAGASAIGAGGAEGVTDGGALAGTIDAPTTEAAANGGVLLATGALVESSAEVVGASVVLEAGGTAVVATMTAVVVAGIAVVVTGTVVVAAGATVVGTGTVVVAADSTAVVGPPTTVVPGPTTEVAGASDVGEESQGLATVIDTLCCTPRNDMAQVRVPSTAPAKAETTTGTATVSPGLARTCFSTRTSNPSHPVSAGRITTGAISMACARAVAASRDAASITVPPDAVAIDGRTPTSPRASTITVTPA